MDFGQFKHFLKENIDLLEQLQPKVMTNFGRVNIGIGMGNNKITEKLAQERENNKRNTIEQNSDILDILRKDNDCYIDYKIKTQDDFDKFISWKRLHNKLGNTDRKIDLKMESKGVINYMIEENRDPEECLIEQQRKKSKTE